MKADSAFFILPSSLNCWLPDMDLNHDKQIQSLLCYRYTIGQAGAFGKLDGLPIESRIVEELKGLRVEAYPVRAASRPALTLQRFNASTT